MPTDERCHVEGMDGVYAADMTTYPIKQGGLATQQADTIAADIAARHAGLRAGDWPIVRVLRARLIGGAQPVDLFATLDGAGRPLDARLDAACGPAATLSAAAHTKVYGRHLTPYLSARARRLYRSLVIRAKLNGVTTWLLSACRARRLSAGYTLPGRPRKGHEAESLGAQLPGRLVGGRPACSRPSKRPVPTPSARSPARPTPRLARAPPSA